MLLSARIRSTVTDADVIGAATVMTLSTCRSRVAPTSAPKELRFLRRLVADLSALRPTRVLFDVVLGRFFEQRAHLVFHRLDPVGDLHPFGAVPLLHVSGMVAVVIGARHVGDRCREVGKAELLPALGGNGQRLQATPYVFTAHDLLAGDLLRVADRFGDKHGVVDTAIVEILAELVLFDLALALVHDVFPDVLEGRVVAAEAVEVEREIALAFLTGATGVIVAARPPDPDEMIHRITIFGGPLHRSRIHRAPAPHDHPGWTIAPDCKPLRRLVLHILAGYRVFLDLEAVVFCELLQQRQRLAAIAALEEDEADGLALELVEAALFIADIAEDHRQTVPIGRRRIEDPRKLVAHG